MEYSPINSCVADIGSNIGADRQTGVSCVTFDTHEELLWMGNASGHLTSYYSYTLDKYTSFHVDHNNDIRDVLTPVSGVLALTKDSLRLSKRRGLTIFTHKSELLMRDMQCMTLLPSGLLLMAGHQEKLIELDIERVKHVRVTDIAESGCVIMKQHPQFVCLADPNGKITLRDTVSLKIQQEFQSHSMLSSIDVCGNYLITCGFSERHGNYIADHFLMLYDLRQMKAVAPIPMPNFSPYLIKFLPKFAAKCCVVSQTGQFNVFDVGDYSQRYIHSIQLPPTGASITSLDVSSTGQALAFGDDHNFIYLYGACGEVDFNMNSKQTEFADPIEPVRPVPITDLCTPVSEISPFPYWAVNDKLLSDLPPDMCRKTYRPVPAIDPDILRTIRMVGSIGYAPNQGKSRLQMRTAVTADSANGSKRNSPEDNEMPHRYYFLEPNYDKIDKDEYDFSRYNHSPFVGLDSTLPNSYSNNMIQALYFIRPLCAGIMGHVCKKEYCLVCELGFLFHMLDISPKHTPCMANNLLRAFRTMPEASALNLIFPDDETIRKTINYVKLSQQWLRFILSQLDSEETKSSNDVFEISGDDQQSNGNKSDTKTLSSGSDQQSTTTQSLSSSSSSFINDLFALSLLRIYQCKCDHQWEQPHKSFPITLSYPTDNLKCTEFVDLLKHSVLTEQTIQTYCEKCAKYQHVVERREAKSIPHILAINTGLDNEQAVRFWKNQVDSMSTNNDSTRYVPTSVQEMPTPKKACRYGNNCNRSDCKFSHEKNKESTKDIVSWIPLSFGITVDENDKIDFTTSSKTSETDCFIEYELMSVTSVVKKNEAHISNIVSAIRVDKEYFEHRSATDEYHNNWFLFNHYSINPITVEEVVSNDLHWKVPSVLIYVRKDLNQLHSNLLAMNNAVTEDVFGEDLNLASKARRGSISFTPLTIDEMPKKGDFVAMDAEFVTLNQEETELRADGTRSTIKPSQKSVARISCVRGSGPLEGQPFIDDYITTQDQVADYLTKFSGIQPGDLEVGISSKHLTTLKSTYMKLRFLVDTGVIFVGHGLRNDFRVINLVVPPEQVIDTVFLFQSPNFKRMVSLRFLAWHFLDITIQSETHDSIEDAKTALLLYKKYLELKALNCTDEAIENLYDVGRNSGWRVPGNDD
ncbi:PAN2-PAN3 deadenylation complex catalytic subunit PAN2-like [Oppia nitens]|uniref:PAN2-PAN3 deadenylation complex catalytic subunit PAN2-like n=1 Tax=Oppia nitens TaxID=1686743 RepID=UPI0023DC575A|nr:PAN2-PAN3 deadenylation complex catalytic subunit PAN2-like [Oppia nitens]